MDGRDADDGDGADEGAEEEDSGEGDFALPADVGETPDLGHGEHEDEDVGQEVGDAVAVGVGGQVDVVGAGDVVLPVEDGWRASGSAFESR